MSLKAILTDLDGTLYNQAALRRRMMLQLLRAWEWRAVRVLRAYRMAQESLRAHDGPCDVAAEQLRLASESTGYSLDECQAFVERWMEREPLAHLANCIRPGAVALLHAADRRGLRLAVCSDYPARRKLAALGLEDCFDAVVCAQDTEVQRLKPHPRLLQVALERIGISPEDSLYLGDRPDVDAVAAHNAGIRYVDAVPFPQLIHLLDGAASQPEPAVTR